MRHWVNSALSAIEADYQRSADTHLIKLELPNFEGINVYLKDESTHPTGSLKHRLARSLFYMLCAMERLTPTPQSWKHHRAALPYQKPISLS